ncbi:hypothetical protein [Photobacterium sp.]|uniref:DUF6414 family protein n=1 Tax=Photobacterium sp. TaxID=660 RepID=UPI00299ECB15|nr:hypothetical protein [Photobacterium sp.]MDX1303602.1 hypothetical protein [Photobacterium sp.]
MIKNFIYIDEDKLYSLSSQLFEGVTEYVLNEQQLDESNEQQSKDKLLSSKVIADVIRETSKFTEKKFLHDHSFNLFEEELKSTGRLLDLNDVEYSYSDICDSGKSFVKIEAKGNFLNLKELQEFFKHFSDISDAIATLPLTAELQELERRKHTDPKLQSTKKLQAEIDNLIRERKAELAGIPKLSQKGFNTVLEHFGDDIVRLKQEYGDTTFTSCLNSDFLRDSLTAIYRKYSRNTSKKFIVLGVICQCEPAPSPNLDNVADDSNIFSHFENMGEHLYNLETTFNGIKGNEIIVEPIAIYTQL